MVLQQRFQLVLEGPVPGRSHGRRVGARRRGHRLAHELQLFRRLVEPHFVEDRRRVHQRVDAAAGPRPRRPAAVDEPLDQRVHVLVPARRKVHRVGLRQVRPQHLRHLIDGIGRVRAEHLPRPVDAEPLAGPGLLLPVPGLDEQDKAFRVVPRRQHAKAVGLREPGEIEQIVVLPVPVFHVVGAGRRGRGRYDRHPSAHPFREGLTPLGVAVAVHAAFPYGNFGPAARDPRLLRNARCPRPPARGIVPRFKGTDLVHKSPRARSGQDRCVSSRRAAHGQGGVGMAETVYKDFTREGNGIPVQSPHDGDRVSPAGGGAGRRPARPLERS